MNRQGLLFFGLEFVWWLVTAGIIIVVLYPILSSLELYPFQTANIVFILVFITLTRYVFLLRYTFLARRQILKIIFGILCIPVIIYLINEINYFQTFMDEEGLEPALSGLNLHRRGNLINYIRSELLFFGVGALVISIIFPIRMLISVWRQHNRGTV